jgi:hypothetical protein
MGLRGIVRGRPVEDGERFKAVSAGQGESAIQAPRSNAQLVSDVVMRSNAGLATEGLHL